MSSTGAHRVLELLILHSEVVRTNSFNFIVETSVDSLDTGLVSHESFCVKELKSRNLWKELGSGSGNLRGRVTVSL